jgi:hypothetical protein
MSGQSQLALDAYLSSLAALPPVTLRTLTPEGEVRVLVEVSMQAILPRLRPSQADLRGDIDRVVPEIVHWGRMAALQKRVWLVQERALRTWKARQELAYRAQADPKAGWGQGGRVNQEEVAAHYRTAPEYEAVEAAVEAAEEAYLFADVVYRAFKEKREVLQSDVWTARDGSLQRWSP